MAKRIEAMGSERPLSEGRGLRFRKGAKLDPSQVEDYRGQGGGLGGARRREGARRRRRPDRHRRPRPLPRAREPGRGGLGELGSLAGQTVGPGTPNPELAQECRTGAGRERARGLPHRRRRQQRPGVLDEDAAQLRAGADAVLRRADQHRLRRRVVRRRPVLLPGRPVRLHRPRLLRRHEVTARRRGRPAGRGVRPRARVRPSRPEPHRRAAAAPTATPARRAARCASSSRPTATRGSGSAAPSTPASSRTSPGRTSTRRSTPRPPWGTTASRSAPQGRVTPESWTHGSSDQRRTWFVRGIEGSGPNSCDTFKGQV